jgi:hypothetical protein
VVAALLRAQSAPLWTALILTAAVASDVTGYGLATTQILPSPTLQVLAPTGSEPAFAVTQLVVLVLFIALGAIAIKAFYPVTA